MTATAMHMQQGLPNVYIELFNTRKKNEIDEIPVYFRFQLKILDYFATFLFFSTPLSKPGIPR